MKEGATVFSISTRNFPYRVGKTLRGNRGHNTDVVGRREQAMALTFPRFAYRRVGVSALSKAGTLDCFHISAVPGLLPHHC